MLENGGSIKVHLHLKVQTLHLPFILQFDLPGGAQAFGKLKRQRPTAILGAEGLQVDEVVGGHDDGRRNPDHLIYLVRFTPPDLVVKWRKR